MNGVTWLFAVEDPVVNRDATLETVSLKFFRS